MKARRPSRPRFESLESRQLMAVDASVFLELPYTDFGHETKPPHELRYLPAMYADQGGLALEWTSPGRANSIWSDATAEGTRRRVAMPESDPDSGTRNRKITREPLGAPHPEAARTVFYRTHEDPFRQEWVAWDKDDGWYVLIEGTRNMARVRDEFWFRRETPAGPTGLYVTDGSPDSEPTLISPELDFTLATTTMTEVGGKTFAIDSQDTFSKLYVTDRTVEGTEQIFSFPSAGTNTPTLAGLGADRIVFRGKPTNHLGWSNLFVSDGTPEGTKLVIEANRDPGNGLNPSNFASVGEYAIFSARDTAHGTELWRTDGTPEGTYLLVDAYPGSQSSIFTSGVVNRHATYTDGDVAFVVYDYQASDQPELLTVTDGTQEGTITFPLPEGVTIEKEFLRRSNPSLHNGNSLFHVLDGRFYFRTTDGDVWTSDGTSEGTFVLSEQVPEEAKCHGIVSKKLICTSLGETAVSYWAVELRQQGDVNLDGQVTFADFLVLSANFGITEATREQGDLNEDGTIDFSDFLMLSVNFGQELFGD